MEEGKRHAVTDVRIADAATDSDLVIAYLLYALKDVRALSEGGAELLERSIAALIEDTQARALSIRPDDRRPPSRLC